MTVKKRALTAHSCKTYFAIWFEIDKEKNASAIYEDKDPLPEEIGIFNKDEVEHALKESFNVNPIWQRHHFIIGLNQRYDVDVNKMLRITLKNLLGKEDKIKEIQSRFDVTAILEIVPEIAAHSNSPSQILSLEQDIIEFLYKSGTQMDIDYYVV